MKGSPERRGRRPLQPPLGLRRVNWVRVTFGHGRPRWEVAGISNRIPVLRPVGFHTATALVADGVPVVVRHLGAAGPTQPVSGTEAVAGTDAMVGAPSPRG